MVSGECLSPIPKATNPILNPELYRPYRLSRKPGGRGLPSFAGEWLRGPGKAGLGPGCPQNFELLGV